MKVLLLIILICVIFKRKIKKILKEGYIMWASNPRKRYGRYKIRKMKEKNIKGNIKMNNKQLSNYTVVYLPQNNQTLYNRISGGYLL
jgi:hypothetical protein